MPCCMPVAAVGRTCFAARRWRGPAPSTAATLACLACMFPCFFLCGNVAGRYSGDIGLQLLLYAAVSVVVFVGCPLVFAAAQRVRMVEGFQVRRAPA